MTDLKINSETIKKTHSIIVSILKVKLGKMYPNQIISPRVAMEDAGIHNPAVAIDKPFYHIGYFSLPLSDNDMDKTSHAYPEIINFRRSHAKMCSPGKFFRKVFPDLTDDEVRDIVEDYKYEINSILTPNSALKIVEYERPSLVYNKYRYPAGNGSPLCTSCMNYTDSGDFQECLSHRDFVEFYDNIDTKALALQNNDGVIFGRALLWRNIRRQGFNEDEKINLLDRIYLYSSDYYCFFYNYCREHGIYMKADWDSAHSKTRILDPGTDKVQNMTLYYPVDEWTGEMHDEDVKRYDMYPYLDTLSYLNIDQEVLHNGTLTFGGENIGLLSTNGEAELEEDDTDMVTVAGGERVHIDDAVEIGDTFYHIEDSEIVYSDIQGIYIHRDDARYIERNDEWIEDSLAAEDELNNSWIHEEDSMMDYLHDIRSHEDEFVYSQLHSQDIVEDYTFHTSKQGFVSKTYSEEHVLYDLDQSGYFITVYSDLEGMTNIYTGATADHIDDLCLYKGEVYLREDLDSIEPAEDINILAEAL